MSDGLSAQQHGKGLKMQTTGQTGTVQVICILASRGSKSEQRDQESTGKQEGFTVQAGRYRSVQITDNLLSRTVEIE